MPTYEYRCNGCQREFEIQQRMSDPDLVRCEACGEDKLEKLISWTAFGSSDQALYSANPKEALKKPPSIPPKTVAPPNATAVGAAADPVAPHDAAEPPAAHGAGSTATRTETAARAESTTVEHTPVAGAAGATDEKPGT